MMRRSLSLLGLSLIAMCGVVSLLRFRQIGAWRPEAEASLFASYPHSQQFDYFVQEHLGHGRSPGNRLLSATWFPDGQPGIAMEYGVNTSGKGGTVREVYANGFQNERTIQLNAADLKAMNATLRSLPPSSVQPPLNRLLILSFRSGKVWVTRLYDRKHLPVQVMNVYALGSASVDTLSGYK